MNRRGILISLQPVLFAGLFLASLAAPMMAAGQTLAKKPGTVSSAKKPGAAAGSKKPWTPPRTKWGDPDIEGVWEGFQAVTFERPLALGDKQFYTDQEIADRIAKGQAGAKKRKELVAAGKVEHEGFRAVPNYNAIFEYSDEDATPHPSKYTSAIIDPSNGRLPPWTMEQVKYWDAREAATSGRGEMDTAVDQNLPTRCIGSFTTAQVGNFGLGFGGGTPVHPGFSDVVASDVDEGDGFGTGASPGPARRILQSKGFVTLVMGDKPEYRIIPLDGSPHLDPAIREWTGDSRGHWEGDALVIDTTNITYGDSLVVPNAAFSLYAGSGKTLHVIERYTPIDANTMEYRYTIDDPGVYAQPYTVRHLLRRNDSYQDETTVCQEDPKDMANSLANSRADEELSLESGADSISQRAPRVQQLRQQAAAANQGAVAPATVSQK